MVPERNNRAEIRGKPGSEDMRMGLGRVVRRESSERQEARGKGVFMV